MESLEEMGTKAHHKQLFGFYDEAIEIYSAAVRKHGEDKRILNNRCMCYLQIKDYDRALEDANKLIRSYPNYTKSYYRQGEILKMLKRYLEAEEAFQHVLMLDPSCEDAHQQLLETQILEICSQSQHTPQQAARAIDVTGTIEDALSLLKLDVLDFTQDSDLRDDEVYFSDEDVSSTTTAESDTYDPLIDPANPLGCCTLWVGNISEAITEKMLKDLFSKHGAIKSVCVYHQKTCAFINYKDTVSPGKAMKALQGHSIAGRSIIIRFPDSAYTEGLHAATYKKKQKHS